ncbi:hypothetical protein GGI12_000064 [Dipsacomyces acuminosporus]|nr:hypothetical protein GGI12_000064 [Dipsacomyces acuminosporus]
MASESADKEKCTSQTPNSKGKAAGKDSVASNILSRVADSASRVVKDIANSGSVGASASDVNDVLSETKAQRSQREGSTSQSREWMADTRHTNASSPTSASELPFAPEHATAASAFRQAIHASTRNSGLIDAAGNNGLAGEHAKAAQSGTENVNIRAFTAYADESTGGSHQVRLAQNLDGQAVTDFLSQSLPTSMSISHVGRDQSHWKPPARQHGPHAAGTAETADPIAYLQGTTYALDMELFDRQAPASGPSPSSSTSSASTGNNKSWDAVHGASILEEEWELNEAWDRAWMSTAWRKTERKSSETQKAEQVLPSNKNLSYLLKPRM